MPIRDVASGPSKPPEVLGVPRPYRVAQGCTVEAVVPRACHAARRLTLMMSQTARPRT